MIATLAKMTATRITQTAVVLIALTVPLAPCFAQNQTADYVGSAACKTCHPQIYARWSRTRMANVVRDPREHPDAIIPDLSKADPAVVKFKLDDIALVYGSKWKQRYFTSGSFQSIRYLDPVLRIGVGPAEGPG